MNLLFYALTIIVLGAIAAVLSASETAVTAASRLHLHQLAKKGQERASLLLSLQEKMGTLISTILLVNMSLLSGMTALATQVSMTYLGNMGMLVTSLVMGGLSTIYVEVLPKIYVYPHPEKVGMALAPMLKVLRSILAPLTMVIDRVARTSLNFFGMKSSTTPLSSSEELRGAIDLHQGEGHIVHERAMLRSILDLSRVTVAEIMVHRKNIVSFSRNLSFKDFCEKVLDAPYTRIPIWEKTPDNIVGVVNVKNLARLLQQVGTDIGSVMKAPWFIPETTTLFSQLQLFREKRSHQAFVVDEYGSLLGMVTLEDILEEIVGEIIDEHDISLPGVRLLPDGSYLIHGWVTLRDLHRQYDWIFPETHSSTLAGLILNTTHTIPDVGTSVVIAGLRMKILRRNNYQINLIRVTPVKE